MPSSAKSTRSESLRSVPGQDLQTIQQFVPEWAIPPGEILQGELDARHMSQAQLAARTGLSTKHLNQVIKGVVPLSPDTAVLLELALGVPSYVWNGLEVSYQDRLTHEKAKNRLQQFASWLSRFKVPELKKRGVITATDKILQVEEMLRFFGVVSPDAFEKAWKDPLAMSFRRAQIHKVDPYATAVWLRLGEIQAEKIDCGPFDPGALRKGLPRIRQLTKLKDAEGFARLQSQCATVGVAVVFVPEIKGSRASGATKWLSSERVMIVLSDRYKHADGVWFTLFHELAHVLLHPRRQMYVDLDEGDDGDGVESEADQFASAQLLPGVSDEDVEGLSLGGMRNLASAKNVGEGIVAGRYGYVTDDWRMVAGLRHRFDPSPSS